jgi:hypothetical protein
MQTSKFFKMLNSLRTSDSIQKASKTDVLFCSHDLDKADRVNGKFFARSTDPFFYWLDKSNFNCVSIAHPFSNLVGNLTFNFTYSLNRKFAFAWIIDRLARTLGIRTYLTRNSYYRMFKLLSPKAIFITNSFPAICEAANLAKIPLIEVLHGRGYPEVFSYWKDKENIELPSHIISFDSISSGTFAKFRRGLFQVSEMIDPWNSAFLEEIEKRPYPKLSRSENLIWDKPTVLFSMQWGYNGDHGIYEEFDGLVPNGLIPESVLQAVKESQDYIDWKFRLHPAQLPKNSKNTVASEKINQLLGQYSNAEWKDSSFTPLPKLLNEVTHHITLSSMTCYEAAEVGIPSLLVCKTVAQGGVNSQLFGDLIANGIAVIGGDNSKNILDWISRNQLLTSEHVDNVSTSKRQIIDFMRKIDS